MQENLPPAAEPSEFQDFFSYISPAHVTPTSQTDVVEASVPDAARLLGITERSIWRRIKAGRLQAKTEHGKTIVAIRQSDVRPTSQDSIIEASVLDTDVVLAHNVGSTVFTNEERKRLQDLIESQSKVIENQAHHLKAAGDVIVYLRSQNEDKDERIKLLTDSEHKKPSWWRRLGEWLNPVR